MIADAGHESRELAQTLKRHEGWELRIVKRRQRAFKITGLTWIVERSFAWLSKEPLTQTRTRPIGLAPENPVRNQFGTLISSPA